MTYWEWRNAEEDKLVRRGMRRCRHCSNLNCNLTHRPTNPKDTP